MRVAAGTKNPAKLKGIKAAFEKFFDKVVVVPLDVDSGVPSQPFDDETIMGAINRAKNAYREGFNFSVGVEAGLFKNKFSLSGCLDFQVACVFNGEKYTIGFGPGFEYPKKVIKEVLKGREVGEVMEGITGIKDLGKKFGAIGFLTRKAIKRENLTELAVTMALIPWINSKLYDF